MEKVFYINLDKFDIKCDIEVVNNFIKTKGKIISINPSPIIYHSDSMRGWIIVANNGDTTT